MKLVLTGGGTAGHAMVNKILLPRLQERGWDIVYIGSKNGIEREMFETENSLSYFSVAVGKLRRYLSWQTIRDFFLVFKGIWDSYQLLKREKPQVIFSGGGFVSVPVLLAAWLLRIPSVIRETDYSMGLANRICRKFAKKVYLTFPNERLLKKYKNTEYAGMIIRPQLLNTHYNSGEITFQNQRPVILILGGSQGSSFINQSVYGALNTLLTQYNVIHICGRGKSKVGLFHPNYVSFEFVEDMSKVYASADVILTRSGSNAVCEGLSLGKRMICIPLSKKNSRGDQMENAEYAAANGCAKILMESNLNTDTICNAIKEILDQPNKQNSRVSARQIDQLIYNQIVGIEETARVLMSHEEWKLYEGFL